VKSRSIEKSPSLVPIESPCDFLLVINTNLGLHHISQITYQI